MNNINLTKEIIKFREQIEFNTYDLNIGDLIRLYKNKKLIYKDKDEDKNIINYSKEEYIFLESLILRYPKQKIEVYKKDKDTIYTYDIKIIILYSFLERELKLKGYLFKYLENIKYNDLENIIKRQFLKETVTIIKYY
ncbi:hypothetical protein V6O07_01230 [Arthrospira platensis SPKY2]